MADVQGGEDKSAAKGQGGREEEDEGVCSGWLPERRGPQRAALQDTWRQALHDRRLPHQGNGTGFVQKTRRIRRVSSRRLHHLCGEERSLLHQAHGEAVLRRSRLRHPANPWQVCLHRARRLWILHHGRVHFQGHHYAREVQETRQQDSGVLCGRLQHRCGGTKTLQ